MKAGAVGVAVPGWASVATKAIAAVLLAGSVPAGGEDSQFEEWRRKEQESLRQFQEAGDREFAEGLERDWQEYRAFAGNDRDDTPKPQTLPVAAPEPELAPEVSGRAQTTVRDMPLPEVAGSPAVVPAGPPERPVAEQGALALSFFGATLTLEPDRQLVPGLAQRVDQEVISGYWEALSGTDWRGLLSDARKMQERTGLNDWGYYRLMDRAAETLCGGDARRKALLLWFLLSKSGYDTRVGYGEQQVHLLVRTRSELYQVPYLELDGERFYVVSAGRSGPALESLYTHDRGYPGADRALDIRLSASPRLGEGRFERELAFEYRGQEQRIPVPVSSDAVEYFATHPQTDYEVYFAAGPSALAEQALLRGLKPLVAGTTEREAVGLLLQFVQTAFAYRTDAEQFRAEKPLFVEETLFYPFSDCEDRSVLFAYLVRRLLGLAVVGLDYPGHVATAVRFSDAVPGEAVTVGEERYLICDPTYINAGPGQVIPACSGMTPEIIAIGP